MPETTAERIERIEREIDALDARLERCERRLFENRTKRDALKAQRKRGRPLPLPSLRRVAAYTRAIKRDTIEADNLEGAIAVRGRVVRKLKKRSDGTVAGLAARVLDLADAGKITFPLVLTTGGTARRDFEQLARLGRVRVPATGEWVTPSLRMMRYFVNVGQSLPPHSINAFVGGIHSPGSRHYEAEAEDTGRQDQPTRREVVRNGLRVYDEDSAHDHNHEGDTP